MLNSKTGNSCSIFGGLLLLEVEVRGHSHYSILDLGALAAVRLCNLFHVLEDHRGDLFRLELLLVPVYVDTDQRLVLRTILNCEGPELHVFLDDILIEAPANESFNVIDGVLRVSRRLVFGSLTDEALTVAETHVAGRDVVAHVVLDDVDLVLAPDTDAGIGRA